MLQLTCIGHLGGDAEVKSVDGREFISFRVAHTERWTDANQQVHESTSWIDCTMDGKPKVFEFLKRGTMVCVSGSCSTRIYSSAKDRCMKAGLQIRVRSCELLGTRPDIIPSRLYSTEDGHEYVVDKFFHVNELVRDKKGVEWWPLVSRAGDKFVVDRNGWVTKFEEPDGSVQAGNDAEA